MKNDKEKIIYPNIQLSAMFELNLKKWSVAFAIWFNWNYFKLNSNAILIWTFATYHISLVLQKQMQLGTIWIHLEFEFEFTF